MDSHLLPRTWARLEDVLRKHIFTGSCVAEVPSTALSAGLSSCVLWEEGW